MMLPTREAGRVAHDQHRAQAGDDVVTHEIDEYDWGVACQDCYWTIITLEDDPGVEFDGFGDDDSGDAR